MDHFGVPTPWTQAEGYTGRVASARRERTPRGLRPRARMETPRTGTGRSHVCRRPEGPQAAPEVRGHKPVMDGRGKSDGSVLPVKPPNKAGQLAAEAVEGRGPAKGNLQAKSGPPLLGRY